MTKARNNSQGIVTLASVNSGQLAGDHNRIINGDMRISHRGSIAASTALNTIGYGGADRFATAILGTSISAGTLSCSTLNGTSSGMGQWVSGLSGVSITVVQLQRIESIHTQDLNNKTVTISGKIYQDTGSTVNYTVRVNAPTVKDNFSNVNPVGSATLNVPTGVLTPFSYTLTLGASSATNGLSVEVSNTSAFTITSKNIGIGDIQLELGSVASPFEWRFYDDELRRCQRYAQTPPTTTWVGAWSTNLGSWVFSQAPLLVPMRATPTVAVAPTGYTIQGYTSSAAGFSVSAGTTAYNPASANANGHADGVSRQISLNSLPLFTAEL